MSSATRSSHPWWQATRALSHASSELEIAERGLRKALNGEYRALLFPQMVLFSPDVKKIFHDVLSHQMRIHVQVLMSQQQLWTACKDTLREWDIVWDVVLDQSPRSWDFCFEMLHEQKLILTFPGFKNSADFKLLGSIPEAFKPTVEFYFPYLPKEERFSPRNIMRLQKKMRSMGFGSLKTPQGIDLFEPRIEADRDVEPQGGPIYQSHRRLAPKISVVIPVFNNPNYLLNTLRHLEHQTFPRSEFEVIIVDDGSDDQTSEVLEKKLPDFQIPITGLYFPRLKKREMGDNQFRAGLARNYGVRFARGEFLVFLDSDILIPESFLQNTFELLDKNDVIQWRRDDLRESVNGNDITYQQVKPTRDCVVAERGYWQRFYQVAARAGWRDLPDHWKYTCSYALALRKDLFKKTGWFRKTFCCYGLEDTDLGWRLAQAERSFYLHNEPVYHLPHAKQRSEYKNSSFQRQKRLKTTAEIFFYNHLSPEIYRVFQYLLNSWIF